MTSTPFLSNKVENFRDIASSCALIRRGTYFRSAAPYFESTDHVVTKHGIRTVIDLRSDHEQASSEEDWRNKLRATYSLRRLNVDLLDKSAIWKGLISEWPWFSMRLKFFYHAFVTRRKRDCAALILSDIVSRGGLSCMYRLILECSDREKIRDIFRAFADPSAFPILVHCTLGKDRTGVVTALLLALLGASDEVIAADFATWDPEFSQKTRERYHTLIGDAGTGSVGDLPDAPKEVMCGVLEYIRREHGSIENYMTTVVGLTADEIAKIRTNLM